MIGRTNILVLMLAGTATTAIAQLAPPDAIPAAGGEISIQPLAHATMQITHGRRIILIDPALDGVLPPPPIPPGAPPPPPPPPAPPGADRTARYRGLPKATIILITHGDEDHFATEAVTRQRTAATRIVAPSGVAARLSGATAIANGERIVVDGIQIEAVPMYNQRRGPGPGTLFHAKGQGNGYVLTIGQKRLYVSGDTECTPEVRSLKGIDVAFLPMNLPFTMTADEAADCALAFKPGIVYPYHYAGQDVRRFAAALTDARIEVRTRNWYPLIQ